MKKGYRLANASGYSRTCGDELLEHIKTEPGRQAEALRIIIPLILMLREIK
jgi:hypothetical protein